MHSMRERIIKALELIKGEVDKRNEIAKYGVDLCNYENDFLKAAIEMLVYNLFLINKKTKLTEKEIKDDVEWWLWERVKKEFIKNGKRYNVKSAKSFVKFLVDE